MFFFVPGDVVAKCKGSGASVADLFLSLREVPSLMLLRAFCSGESSGLLSCLSERGDGGSCSLRSFLGLRGEILGGEVSGVSLGSLFAPTLVIVCLFLRVPPSLSLSLSLLSLSLLLLLSLLK